MPKRTVLLFIVEDNTPPSLKRTHFNTKKHIARYDKTAASSNMILVTGRTSSVVLVRNRADLTRPSRPGDISLTTASGHRFLGVFSSAIKTRSPTAKFHSKSSHFTRFCSSGRYSLFHLHQNLSAMCCAWRHLRRYISRSLNLPGGNTGPPFSKFKWFGVNGLTSSGSSLSFVSGRPLIMFSISQKTVSSISSFNRGSFSSTAFITRFIDPTILSQEPPICGDDGGMNFHSIFRCSAYILTCFMSRSFAAIRISFSPPTKFPPLSENTVDTLPLRAINRLKPLINVSVSSEFNFSTWIALVVMQVNTQP